MGGKTNYDLCHNLLSSENENEVIETLKRENLWNSENDWQIFGNKENNYSIIGNQSAFPVNALVEKIVNSVDAVLLRECKARSIDPESTNAPRNINSALEKFFDIKDGNLSNLDANKRSALAQNIGLIATGKKNRPNFIIFDKGEGQEPVDFRNTLLSLSESNKLKIPFVQGKFNMGGTGVFRFSGENSINLIVSKKFPEISSNRDKSNEWGFTVIRRDNPSKGRRNSIYRYLAPNNNILSFEKQEIEIPTPFKGTQSIPSLQWGTIIKIFDYELPAGLKSNILLDLYNQISLLIPRVGLPVRFYERRDYGGHSVESTLSGLNIRLEEDKRENLESQFPTSSSFRVDGQQYSAVVYAFKPGSSLKYRKEEGILFTNNGQTHGHISKMFFNRNKIGLSYIADSILVIVDTDKIDERTREKLFMNSRDRLSAGELRNKIEDHLETILKEHPGLRELKERRRREAIETKFSDTRPLINAVQLIINKSPSLQSLFLSGNELSNPFKSKNVDNGVAFQGKTFPTYFRLCPGQENKIWYRNLRSRAQFDTDVVNDYFNRDKYRGSSYVSINGNELEDYTLNIWQGRATLTMHLPENFKIGDHLECKVKITDETQIEPFVSIFYREIEPDFKGNGGGTTGRTLPPGNGFGERTIPDSLSLPKITEVTEEMWNAHGFTKFTALKVINIGNDAYDFYINLDNIYLKTDIKGLGDKEDLSLIKKQFEYSLVLIGLSLLKDNKLTSEIEKIINIDKREEINPSDLIEIITSLIAPVILPIVNQISNLELDEITL
jgi:hypothetical protein